MARPRLPWIKLYGQILTSDIMTMPANYRWNFIGLLLIANDEPERGKIRPHWIKNNRKLLANRIGVSTKLLANSVRTLSELGVITEDASGISINNYHIYQRVTDNKQGKQTRNKHKTDALDRELDREGELDREKEEIKSEPDKPEPTPKKAIIYPSLPEVLTYFIDCAHKEFTNINTEAVETEAKLYHSIRTGDKWVKANKKKVKNWKLDARQWILSKRSKLIDYDQKKSTRLLPSNDTAAFIEGVKTW